MEQKAKQDWDDKHFGDPNPYADLPRMQILTFTLPKMVRDEKIENNEVFKFHEFFRVWTDEDKQKIEKQIQDESNPVRVGELKEQLKNVHIGQFVYESAVSRFLDKLVEESDNSQYPFSTDEFRDNFKHTFWLLPGVKEAKALEELLAKHDVFGVDNGMFHIVNVAGDGNIEDIGGKALKAVQDAIKKYDRTITLSCGKLTTGVSVPEWTAVLCMKGSENTPAANYMQTIFRVQTHATLSGRQKSECYVFDFAPDRALTAVAETAKFTVVAAGGKDKRLKKSQKEEEEHLEAFIKLCPVLSMDEGEMGKHISATQIFEKLSNVYIERAVRSGYADNSLYDAEKLLNLTPEQEAALGDVHDLLGSMPGAWKPEKITINDHGLGKGEGDEDVQIYYYITDKEEPTLDKPTMSGEFLENGAPIPSEDIWSASMGTVGPLFPYLYACRTVKRDGEWSDFSKPILYRQYVEVTKTKDQQEREKQNKEKRARMSVLRGVSIRIPLLVYGAEINDEDGGEITIDNFTSLVDQPSWDEYMPDGFKKETFDLLRDCFDRAIFTGAAKRIRAMVKEADNLNTEDRIAKIATIFSYFHNPDKETVLTPWRVVNMHMSDTIGGWCFMNEQFDGNYAEENEYGEAENAARWVPRDEVTEKIFGNYNSRILEINSKTGLYPLYMAYSLFRTSKEKAYRESELTKERGKYKDGTEYSKQAVDDLTIWADVLQDNIFVVCRTTMAASITRRTLGGFRKDLNMNVVCYSHAVEINDLISAGIIKKDQAGITKNGNTYFLDGKAQKECDMIDVLRAKPSLFEKDVVKGHDFWHVYNSIPTSNNEDINDMKFSAIVGNPPYQIMDGGAGASATPIYNQFVQAAKKLNPLYCSMITPSRWFAGGKGLDRYRDEMITDRRIRTIVNFINGKECFPSASTGSVNYFLWDKDYSGDCEFYSILNSIKSSPCMRALNEFPVLVGNNTALSVIRKVRAQNESNFGTSVRPYMPFGLRSYVRGESMPFDGSITLYSSAGTSYYRRSDITECTDIIGQYKIMTSKLLAEHAGEPDKLGKYKVLSRTEIIEPETACTESYLILAAASSLSEINNYYSYCCTKFFRFLLLQAMSSINMTSEVFLFVPMQDFSHSWTDKDLYDKYGIDEKEQAYIEQLIKPME